MYTQHQYQGGYGPPVMHPPPPQHLVYQGDGQASETSSVRSVTQRMETIGERVPLVREVCRSWGPSGASSSIAPPDAAQLQDLADMQTEEAQGEGADATAAPAAEAEDPDDARTYVLLTKEGNSTKFTRDQVLMATGKHLQSRILKLCKDFRVGNLQET